MTTAGNPAVLVVTPAATVTYVVRGRLAPAGFECIHCRDVMEAEQQVTWLAGIGQTVQAIIVVDPSQDEKLTVLRQQAPGAQLIVLLNDGLSQVIWQRLCEPVDLVALEPVSAGELQHAVRTGSFDSVAN